MMWNVVKIIVIIVFVVDYSGFVDVMKEKLFRFLYGNHIPYKGYSLKPFDCSLCLSFWTVLLYLIFNNTGLVDSMLIACLAGFLAKIISPLFALIEQLIFFLYDSITEKIDQND